MTDPRTTELMDCFAPVEVCSDERQDVADHWRGAKSWIVPSVAVSCHLLGGGGGRARTSNRLHSSPQSAGAAGSRRGHKGSSRAEADCAGRGRSDRYCGSWSEWKNEW